MPKPCETCVYFVPVGSAERFAPTSQRETAAYGECHIGPPEAGVALDKSRWPLTWADEGCGCHHPVKGADGGDSPPEDPTFVEYISDDGGGVVFPTPPACGCAQDDKPDVLPIPPRPKPPGGSAA